ncbi:MAG: 16S rRNA (guanine(966)-N(2))-methyltransferase RsmD [Nitrospirota bacterium]
MRISGGSAKGRKVGFKRAFRQKDESDELRPTSAKVREAIFNILRDQITDAVVLDLYAGTGAVGIEALSRGAGRVVFVEHNPQRVSIIKDLTERFGFKDRGVVIKERADRFLKRTEYIFDIIFVDPPYRSEELATVLPLIDARDVLSDRGVLIAEHHAKKKLPASIGNLELKKVYKYGDTSLSVYCSSIKRYSVQ